MLNGGGGEDPPKSLTPQQRREWNQYVDFVAKKGYKGSPLLDKKETGLATSLFNEFKKANPNTSISLDHVAAVQTEMQNLAKAAQAFEARRGNPNATKIMQGTSKIDSWPGSKTTSFKFPDMEETIFNNGAMTSNRNLGILDSRLKPTDSLSKRSIGTASSTTPVKLEKFADGYYYQNRDGDYIKYNQ